MKTHRLLAVMVCTIVLGLVGGTAWAEQPIMNVYVKFDFKVQDKTLPAGYYVVMVSGPKAQEVLLKNDQTDEVTPLPIMTRLAELETKKARLVFDWDEDGDEYFLAEIHVPDMDGFAVEGVPAGVHKHETVSGED